MESRKGRQVVAELNVTLTCPECVHRTAETMPTDRCVFFHQCRGCKAVLKPRAGDCFIYCSYGSVRCPFVHDQTSCPG